jgi:hypothetical protein
MKAAKYIVVMLLVIGLIGVAYVRALWSHQERPQSQAGMVSSTEVNRLIDSLRSYYIDSVGSAAAYSSPVPAISVSGDSLKAEIAHLESDLATANDRIKVLVSDNTRQTEKVIRTFYDHEVAALPADLTSYERTVSIKEIRGKVMKYFGVSAETLNHILSRKR